jgi:hypothetical protein
MYFVVEILTVSHRIYYLEVYFESYDTLCTYLLRLIASSLRCAFSHFYLTHVHYPVVSPIQI